MTDEQRKARIAALLIRRADCVMNYGYGTDEIARIDVELESLGHCWDGQAHG